MVTTIMIFGVKFLFSVENNLRAALFPHRDTSLTLRLALIPLLCPVPASPHILRSFFYLHALFLFFFYCALSKRAL